MRLSVVSVLVFVSVVGQDSPQGVVAGTIVNEITGEPVRRASVVLTGEAEGRRVAPVAIETLGDGAFRFEGLGAGTYSLVAQKPGYLETPPSGRLSQFLVGAGQQRTALVVKLWPQGVLSGSVFDEAGEPLQGASVQVMRRKKGVGGQAGDSTRTNDRGEFRLPNLDAGEYVVVARYDDPALARKTGAAVRAQVYPASHSPAVTVRRGAETAGIDLRLRREAAYRVRVRLEGGNAENPLVGVLGRDLQERAGIATRTGVPRQFEIAGVPAGSWYVVADGYSAADEWLSGVTAIDLTNADLSDVVVHLGEGRPLTGVFVFDGPTAARPRWQGLRVGLSPGESSRGTQMTCEASENGVFALHYALPGQYTIEVKGPLPAGVYLASIKVGAQDFYGKELDLSGAPPDPVTILFRHGTARVSGVLDGRVGDAAEERGFAMLVPVEEHLRRVPYVQTVAIQLDGTFSFPSVRPGEYLVCHTLDGEVLPESLDSAVRQKVEPNGSSKVSLRR